MRERLLQAHVWVVATLIPLLVKFIPLKALLKLLTPRRAAPLYRELPIEQITRVVRNRLSNPIHMVRRACV